MLLLIPAKDLTSVTLRAILVAIAFAMIFLLGASVSVNLCGCGAAVETPDGGDPDGGDVDGGDSDSDSDSETASESASETSSDTASETASETFSESVSDREGFWTPCISILKGTTNFCGALCPETGIGTCSETCVADLDGDLHGAEGCAGEIAGQVGSCNQLWASYGDLSVRCCCGS